MTAACWRSSGYPAAHRHCPRSGKPVAIGGPDATSKPPRLCERGFLRARRSRGVIEEFVAAWRRARAPAFSRRRSFSADVTKSPIPRFDLLKFEDYLYIGVQFSRGCPFTCEFCDIIELYGRRAADQDKCADAGRTRGPLRLGYRGHVDFVDDNLIGNKKAVKAFLPGTDRLAEGSRLSVRVSVPRRRSTLRMIRRCSR